jgi:hypothetical protein
MIPFSPIHRQGLCVSNGNNDKAGSDFFVFFKIFSGIYAESKFFLRSYRRPYGLEMQTRLLLEFEYGSKKQSETHCQVT